MITHFSALKKINTKFIQSFIDLQEYLYINLCIDLHLKINNKEEKSSR